jgi:hypothetical protein
MDSGEDKVENAVGACKVTARIRGSKIAGVKVRHLTVSQQMAWIEIIDATTARSSKWTAREQLRCFLIQGYSKWNKLLTEGPRPNGLTVSRQMACYIELQHRRDDGQRDRWTEEDKQLEDAVPPAQGRKVGQNCHGSQVEVEQQCRSRWRNRATARLRATGE